MIDLDIPTNTPPQTNTLLHHLQTGLSPATTATGVTLAAPNNMSAPVAASVFFLENRSNTTALSAYIGPNPPARVPLSHRYTHILVDTSNVTAQGIQALRAAASGNRVGFNASAVLTEAGLVDRVVAGNFFNVTNPGPVTGAIFNANGTTDRTEDRQLEDGAGSSSGSGSAGGNASNTAGFIQPSSVVQGGAGPRFGGGVGSVCVTLGVTVCAMMMLGL